MESPSLSISIIFLFVFSLLISSSKPLLSSTLGVDAISRILQIQDLERAPLSVQEAAARSLLLRLLPSHSSAFYFRIISKAFQFLSFFLSFSPTYLITVYSWPNLSSFQFYFTNFVNRINAEVNIVSLSIIITILLL